EGEHTRILVAAVVSGLALLNLLWFVAALTSTLMEAGQDGWAVAAIIASAVFGGMFFLLAAMSAALAYSIASPHSHPISAAMNDFLWAGIVLTSFPRAMLMMAVTFGLWRAKLISNALFAMGVVTIVLVLAGGTAWLSNGAWAPDGL